MSWLTKWLGTKAVSSGQGDVAALRRDLDRLDAVIPDLGAQALRYVLTGENDSVLLTLGQNQQKVAEALGRNYWSSTGNWTDGRSDYVLAPHDWQPAILRRYGEVLAIARGNRSYPPLPGSDRTPRWLATILVEYADARGAVLSNRGTPNSDTPKKLPPNATAPFTIAKLRALLETEPAPSLDPIPDMAFENGDSRYGHLMPRHTPEAMPDFDDFLREDPVARTAEIARLSPKARAYGMRLLARKGLADGAWFDLAFIQASDSSKSAREAAVVLLKAAAPDLLLARVEASFPGMKASQKIEIARAVAVAGGPGGVDLLRRLLEAEDAARVAAELERLIGQESLAAGGENHRPDGSDGYLALDRSWVEAPPLAELPLDSPVSPALQLLIDRAFAEWRADDERHNREESGKKYFHRRVPPPATATDRFCRLVAPGGETLPHEERDRMILNVTQLWNVGKEREAVQARILAHPDLTLWHILRMHGHDYGRRGPYRLVSIFHGAPTSNAARHRLQGMSGLRTYAAACVALGDPADGVIRGLLEHSWGPAADLDDWSAADLWPYFAHHFVLIDEALGLAPPSGPAPLQEDRALELLAIFPKTPARYFSALVDRAVGDRKQVRGQARDLLDAAPGLDSLLIPLLDHPKQETRIGAAHWLAERGAQAALPALLAAAKKEKLAPARAALLGAIARLGGDIGGFVSPGTLLEEARAGLKKASGKELEWFPFETLPRLRLSDGAELDPTVPRWWLTAAVKLKQPGGNAWFELLLDQLDPASAERLGAFVLQAWISHDTVRPSEEEANTHARAHVDATLKGYQRWMPDMTWDRAFAILRNGKLAEYRNSGNDSKGILALATRASGADSVALVRSYFRDHYPRTAQCKALIECLAANPSPVATQFVLSIAKRWRTRTVQDLAGQLVAAIAERRGWTAEELADRTVPTGGFGDDGVLPLPIGDRAYAARLADDGKIQLHNPDGKAVQGLPSAGAGETKEALSEAKSALSNARKELKQVFDFQPRRLYEALCVGREWAVADWSEHLLRHPLVGRMVQRLLWVGLDQRGRRIAAFRPMEDLTLTDTEDAAVGLDGLARVRLAHRTDFTEAEVAAWRRHITDYEVKPLFDQLGRPLLALSVGQAEAIEITDRRGWLIEAFKLRGPATKLGYTRGSAQDGGVFTTYEKGFNSLNVTAVVEFTGNSLPEENRLTALLGLRFLRMRKGGGLRFDKPVPLKEVPAVLLSEAWNDLHAMAAAGAGYDPDWEKKAAW